MKMKKIMKFVVVASVMLVYGLTAMGSDDSSSSDDYDYSYKTETTKKSSGYEDFNRDVDKAGNGDGKADWDDWNAYADENGYNRAY